MRHCTRSRIPALAAAALLAAAGQAQHRTGELRLQVRDAAGLALKASGELLSEDSHVRRSFLTDPEGRFTAKGLPFGPYVLRIEREGFAAAAWKIEIRSEVPTAFKAVLEVAAVETTVEVTPADTLLDPHRTGATYSVGREMLREQRALEPGRAAIELVEAQPGWLLEANGVLHPRGSEYNTQYVIDGVPVLDNRSPAFAPGIETEELQSMNVLTATYPAEYGRKLGGVVEVATERDERPGFHWRTALGGGSFGTANGFLSGQYTRGRVTAGLAAESARTDRFLDPPVEENYTNHMSGAGLTGRLEADITGSDRVRAYFHSRRSHFLVPNETLQEEAGQRQDRRNQETMGQISYQRVLSPQALASVRGMVRDLSAALWSNPLSTPINAEQDRGFREGYAGAAISFSTKSHELKAGADAIFSSLYEGFGYRITDPESFDQDVPPRFRFAGRADGREQSLFAQDTIRLGRLTVSAGLRWDNYRLLVTDRAFSPRLGAAWYWPGAGLVFRASYDRAFELPSIENLLLASSRAAQTLTDTTTGLPVPPSRGNFYQAGFAKSLFGRFRLDANWFRRDIHDFSDDDLLLNTGVTFPIAFARAHIHGFEAKLELPAWGRLSGFASYSNMSGTGWLPITGGLFLEPDSARLLSSNHSFPITQDQRNTVNAQVRCQATRRVWAALAGHYGSGLPVELPEGASAADFAGSYSPEILERVNFSRGRVRPWFALDASAGVHLWDKERSSARLQFDVLNLTGRLNVINFAGVFSGTALAISRSFSMRLQADF